MVDQKPPGETPEPTVRRGVNSFVSDAAVTVFFVLSSYLISSSIDSNIKFHGRFHIMEYAFNRAVRIIPPLLFAMVLAVSIYVAMTFFDLPGIRSPLALRGDLYSARGIVTLTTDDIVNTLTMRNGLLIMNGPLWSLYVEVKLYALAGVLAFAAIGNLPIALRAIIAVGAIWLASRLSLGIDANQIFYAVWWIVGCVFFLIDRLEWSVKPQAFALLIASAGAILLLSPVTIPLEAGPILFIFGLAYAMFYRWTWTEPVTKTVSGYSYTLYLAHFPILLFSYALVANQLGAHAPTWFDRALASSLGVSAALLLSWGFGSSLESTSQIKQIIRKTAFAIGRT